MYVSLVRTDIIIYQPLYKDLDNLKQSFADIASQGTMYKEISEKMYNKINVNRQNSILACCEYGMRSNFFFEIHQKNFGIDATFCISTNTTIYYIQISFQKYFKKANLSENTCLNDFYTYEEFDNVDNIDIFKIGRATGLTLEKFLSNDTAISIDLTNESIKFILLQ